MPPPVKMPISAVRAAYENGDESIRAIAHRYGISDRAIRKRAKAEGWIHRQRKAGMRFLTDQDVEAMIVTANDLAGMAMTADDLAQLSADRLFGRR